MQVNDDNMDELFARKLGDMEVAPPEDGWVRIESELNRRSRMARRYWLTAASFALILSVTATMVYMQTNLDVPQMAVVSVSNNTSQPPQQQPSTIDDHDAEQLEENGATAQQNASHIAQQRAANSLSVSQTENAINEPDASLNDVAVADVREDEIADANIPAYIDSWNELRLAQPMKVDWRKIMSNKIAQIKMEMPQQKTGETVASVATTIPRYDEIGSIDFTAPATTRTQPRRWVITGQFAPVHSYRTISGVPNGMRKSDFDNVEKPLLAYSGGINLSYRVFGRWNIQTGVFYTQMGQLINSVIPVSNMNAAISSSGNPYNKNFINTSSGSVIVVSNLKSDANTAYSSYFSSESQTAGVNSNAIISGTAKYRLVERLDYLEIPLVVQYRIYDRKLNLYVSGGMSANVLINNNVFVDNGSEIVKGGAILMARPVNYSAIMGLGFGYHINRNISIGFEPYFKFFLQPYTTSNQINSNPYALGLFTGVVYRF